MRKRIVLALAGVGLATALVAGCFNPAQVKDLLAASQTELGKQLTNQLLTNLQSYTDIDATQALADVTAGLSNFDDISLSTQALKPPRLEDVKGKLPAAVKDRIKERPGGGPPPNFNQAKDKVKKVFENRPQDKTKLAQQAKPKLQEQRQKVAKRVDKRIKKFKEGFDPSKDFESITSTGSLDPWGDVTIVSATMSLKVKHVTKTHVFDRYYDENKVLVRIVDDIKETFNNKGERTLHRERTNFDDGSYEATVTSSTTLPNGKTRSSTWTRKGSADGTETGEGTITRADGSTNTVTYTKTSDGKTVTSTSDLSTKVKVEVTQTEGDSEANVKTSDTDDPNKKTEETKNTDELEPEA